MALSDEAESSSSPSAAFKKLVIACTDPAELKGHAGPSERFDRLPSSAEALDDLEKRILAPVKDLSSDLIRWQLWAPVRILYGMVADGNSGNSPSPYLYLPLLCHHFLKRIQYYRLRKASTHSLSAGGKL